LRSTVIGAALCRIYAALGYKPIGINHLGDWGTQFGMVMAAYSEKPDEKELHEHPIRFALKLYTEYYARAETDPASRDQAREWFRRLEAGDREAKALWSQFRELSLAEFRRIYQRLGISFDYYMGESFYNDKMDEVIKRVKKAHLLEKGDDGAQLVRLDDEKMPPLLLRKSDGATLYATRDLAAAIYRHETFHPAKILYVVGTPQELHFRQLVRVLEKMGLDWATCLTHVKFGHVQGMSTRHGTAVFLEDVLDEAAGRAGEKVAENVKAGKLDPAVATAELAEAIGIGALIAGDLKHHRERDVTFDWEQALSFDGETGPYLQYTHARICGILRKSGRPAPESADWNLLAEPETRELIKALARFPEAVEKAGSENEPSLITNCLFDLTQVFNVFYNTHRVIGSGGALEDARLRLVDSTRQALRNGLTLLGIKPLEQM
jgi:arginyl-tRNA synthetase